MTIFVVGYDLNSPGQDYVSLIAELRRVKGAKLLESTWIVDVNQTASQLRAALKTYGDSNDGYIVFEVTPFADWAVQNVSAGAAVFLDRNLG
ncbi:MAG: hypothetical protein SGJ23_02430 [Alphaproteobacteria bacterium]|nr:hypothetical protein [Alphaproteobacteria bacterium]